MPFTRLRPAVTGVVLVALIAGGGAVAYAWWTRPLLEADRALAAGDERAALDRYARAEARLTRFRLIRFVLARDYARAAHNQLALLYQTGEYGAVLEKAQSAPPGAAPRFWAGAALLARAAAEPSPDARLGWLNRAEEELRQALAAAPDDWDTKHNYEVAARLAAELRTDPKKKPGAPIQLLRPQPRQAQPGRRAG